jgi:hypothetical protein
MAYRVDLKDFNNLQQVIEELDEKDPAKIFLEEDDDGDYNSNGQYVENSTIFAYTLKEEKE